MSKLHLFIKTAEYSSGAIVSEEEIRIILSGTKDYMGQLYFQAETGTFIFNASGNDVLNTYALLDTIDVTQMPEIDIGEYYEARDSYMDAEDAIQFGNNGAGGMEQQQLTREESEVMFYDATMEMQTIERNLTNAVYKRFAIFKDLQTFYDAGMSRIPNAIQIYEYLAEEIKSGSQPINIDLDTAQVAVDELAEVNGQNFQQILARYI